MFNVLVAVQRSELYDQDHLYILILAGGSGTRLWPYSTEQCPKQLLTINNNQTLLEDTVERVSSLVPVERIWVVTTCAHEQKIRDCVGARVGAIIAEPAARNTGPAIAYCCLQIAQQDPQAVVLSVHADAYIPPEQTAQFVSCAHKALACVEQYDRICLLGVMPTYPATGYGYIEYEDVAGDETFKVTTFREKPALEDAQRYVCQNNMLWNIGVFAASVSRFIQEFDRYAPELMSGIRAFMSGQGSYSTVPNVAVDYAVIEKSSMVNVVPCVFSWCDVGNIAVFLSLKKKYAAENNMVLIDAHNNLVDVPHKLVALIDVDDLCVVQTGDTLLITKKESAEKVRTLVAHLKDNNHLRHHL